MDEKGGGGGDVQPSARSAQFNAHGTRTGGGARTPQSFLRNGSAYPVIST